MVEVRGTTIEYLLYEHRKETEVIFMPAIEVSNLVKQYKGAKSPSVNNISFTVDKGEFFAFPF